MTPEAWDNCTDPDALLRHLIGKAGRRKKRLFACAGVRRLGPLLADERSRQALDVSERYADGLANREELERAAKAAQAAAADAQARALDGGGYEAAWAALAAACAAWVPADEQAGVVWGREWQPVFSGNADVVAFWGPVRQAAIHSCFAAGLAAGEAAQQCRLLRCLFGDLFRPGAVEPCWLTPAMKQLAAAAYAERVLPAGTLDPVRLDILADALEGNGCTDAELLAHLQGPGPHTRGCWAVDDILGRN